MLKRTITKIQFALGLIFLILGIVGIILPILPTTPFVLLAIYFFDRSSKKFHSWCLKIPGIGEGVEDWQKFKVIRKKAKFQASVLLVTSAIIVYFKMPLDFQFKFTVIFILSCVLIFVWTRNSSPRE